MNLEQAIRDLEICRDFDVEFNELQTTINEVIEFIRQQGKELHEAQNGLLTQASLIGDLIRQKKDLKHQNEEFKKNLKL